MQHPHIVNLGGRFPAGSTPEYTALLVNSQESPVPATSINSMTLTIIDPFSGRIINGVDRVNILNADRGVVDEQGHLQIRLTPGDTSVHGFPGLFQIQRSLVIDWTSGDIVGRHQANFTVVTLAGGVA